ncbi:MAG: ATP-binding cassette domain-containing protein [Intestinibacter bartlettii]|uniref:ATP-binding cassette domain-containing protein n=1 Tax=Intestinibacter bartlettii TaxID=261299 RepID=UPI0029105912|nr:ATP-binding cassette domain-containing protein [Intestinibacter bartlettii]MDU6824337.1 ATP-binding cassette domain-containing protein [Intestinibacter bartlettii]
MGAGKTTFIRIITGLAFLTSGELSLFGNSREKELQEARRKIGALVEGPSLYPFDLITSYSNVCRLSSRISLSNIISLE